MSILITRNGRSARSDLSARGLFAGAKRVALHRFQKAVRRDAGRIIQEQLEAQVLCEQEEQYLRLRAEARRMEEIFWGWDSQDEHERELERLYDRQQEQLGDLLDWKARHVYGLS